MNSLSKTKIKYIKSLQLKKYRLQEDRFIVEGKISVLEFLGSDYDVKEVIGTKDFFTEAEDIAADIIKTVATEKELEGLGSFVTNKEVLAIVKTKYFSGNNLPLDEVIIALDKINDPGNLGTIIRIADWYGIKNIIVSNNSVDMYNPKVVSATKGSLTRVDLHYLDLYKYLSEYRGDIYAAYLDGESVNTVSPISAGIILMGSESHGIDNTLSPLVTYRLTIPGKGGAESLNVAVATGIICNQLVMVD